MSTIPRTREELTERVATSFVKLREELDRGGPALADLPCADDWTVKDLLAVRAWWTEDVVKRIEAGKRGRSWAFPAPGYKWNETPRLNADLVRAARKQSYRQIRGRLEKGLTRVLATIDSLDDEQLLAVGAFAWAGKWPVARWIAINTARQYITARAFVRRAVRERDRSQPRGREGC